MRAASAISIDSTRPLPTTIAVVVNFGIDKDRLRPPSATLSNIVHSCSWMERVDSTPRRMLSLGIGLPETRRRQRIIHSRMQLRLGAVSYPHPHPVRMFSRLILRIHTYELIMTVRTSELLLGLRKRKQWKPVKKLSHNGSVQRLAHTRDGTTRRGVISGWMLMAIQLSS